MADDIRGARHGDDEPGLDLQPLLRPAAWGAAAFFALAVVIVVGRSGMGEHRASTALASFTGAPAPSADQTLRASGSELVARADAERESRRTAEALRLLAADRDRLSNRIDALERSLEDLTGSIRRQAEPPRPASPVSSTSASGAAAPSAAALPVIAGSIRTAESPAVPRRDELAPVQVMTPKEPAPAPLPPGAPIELIAGTPSGAAAPLALAATPSLAMASAAALPPLAPVAGSSASAPAPVANLPRSGQIALIQAYASATSPVVPPAPASADTGAGSAARTEFAVDLGTAPSVNALRALWEKTRARQPAHLDSLRPLISVRDGQRPGTMELRLIAGPLTNASAAARLCATLVAAGIHCQPAIYDGQRLALR
jgi:hypothetical protein